MRAVTRFATCGIVLALCLCGCLEYPLGNPQSSRVDRSLTGYWLHEDDTNPGLVALYPYDEHSYVLETYGFTQSDGERKLHDHATYKAWITDVKGRTFITLDAMSQHVAPPEHLAYPILQINGTGDKREVRAIDSDFPAFSNVRSPSDVATVIAREVDNPAMYGQNSTQYRRLDPEKDAATIKSMTISE